MGNAASFLVEELVRVLMRPSFWAVFITSVC